MDRVSAHSLCHQQVRDFHQWTAKNAKDGLTGLYENTQYVPVSSQRECWIIDRIENIFRSLGLNIDAQAVHQDYICVLSVLVDITKEGCPAINYMNNVIRESRNDDSLPWTEGFQPNLCRTHEGNLIFKAFIHAQWQYCPVTAAPFGPTGRTMHNRLIDSRQVFPIETSPLHTSCESRATGSGRAMVAYMNIHSEPNTGAPVGLAVKPYRIVFKTYRSSEAQTFKDEYEANIAAGNSTDSGNILEFLGSFECSSINNETTYTIMSEYADSGTLWDLFLKRNPPYRAEDARVLWESFSGVTHGLEVIHNLNYLNRHTCVHQDLKPSNLFMFKSKKKDNKYAYRIKIGDFGASYAQSTLQGPDGPDRGGSREYSPPGLLFSDTVDYKASAAVDIWAFGCIIVETVVWIALGQDGRQAFRTARKKETQSLANHEQLGRSDCFHDGPSSPSIMTSSLPYVSIQKLEKWVKGKKNKNINDLPGWNAAQSLLAKREIIILIDNSKHMQRHSEEVKNSVVAFSYLFKTLDPNGIDVVMASAPHIKITKKTSTDIKNFVGTEFAAGKFADCFIEMALDVTLDPIKEIWSHNRRNSMILDTFRSPYASSMKSVSIFVFTNGVWDHGKYETSGASTAIQSLIAVMKEHRINRTNASIQFVRFGDSEVGIRRLGILDDELLDADGNEFDIVDHKHITASIWEILIGSLQRAND
ncbi:putative Protein kinase domain-containing protein [Seiridium cardinale]